MLGFKSKIQGCPCCEVLKDENKHLRGLVERLMAQIAPSAEAMKAEAEEELDPRLRENENGSVVVRYGEGS